MARVKVKKGMPGSYYAGLKHAKTEEVKDRAGYWEGRVKGIKDAPPRKKSEREILASRTHMINQKKARDKIESLRLIKQIAEDTF